MSNSIDKWMAALEREPTTDSVLEWAERVSRELMPERAPSDRVVARLLASEIAMAVQAAVAERKVRGD